MFANKRHLRNCIGLMFASKTPRQRSRSTSPRRDPKMRCSRSVCAKRAPQKQFADRHPRANSGKGAPRRFAPTIIAHQGAFDANAPTTFTTTSENVFLSMFADIGHLQICKGLMFTNNCLMQFCMGQMFTNIHLMQNCIKLMFAIRGLMQNAWSQCSQTTVLCKLQEANVRKQQSYAKCMKPMFPNNSPMQNA